MNLDSKEQQIVRKYLLGQGSQEDSTRIEEQLLMDEPFNEDLLIAEEELIDQYLRDELSKTEREGFETHFLAAPERQRKLRFARALHKYVRAFQPVADEDPISDLISKTGRNVPTPPPKPWYSVFLPNQNPILSYSLIAGLVLITAVGAWIVLKAGHDTKLYPGRVLAVGLTPGLTRGEGEIKRIVIPAGIDTVRLEMELAANQDQTYSVRLQDSEGKTLLNKNGVRAQTVNGQSVVVLEVTVSLVPPGDYQLKLSVQLPDGGFEAIDTYTFRIMRYVR